MNNFRFVQAALKLRQLEPRVFGLRCRSLFQRPTQQSVQSNKTKDEENNEPVNYFGSQAATWKAKHSRGGGDDDELWYQPFVISGSVAVFLLYFCIFREENDIDQRLEVSLYDHVPAMEQVQLITSYKHNKLNGLDNLEVIQRLTEIGVDIKQLDIQIAEGN